MILAADSGRLPVNALDYSILAIYFLVVIAIGVMARRAIATSEDFLLSGRSLPAWVTGLAFISANLGAIEILGMAANGAQYGISTVHFYWIGAVPAMVFLGLVMMPFYYGSRVRSVPEYLRRRFNQPTHLFNALTFALAAGAHRRGQPVRAGAGHPGLLGWPIWVSIVVVGRLRARLHHPRRAVRRDLQRGAAVLRHPRRPDPDRDHRPGQGRRLERAEGRGRGESAAGGALFSQWGGTQVGHSTNPLGDWIGIVFGLGFVLSFGYWTTNFAEVQRALSAKNLSAAQRTPLIGAFPKIFIPSLTIIPGLIALVAGPGPRQHDGRRRYQYNDAIPLLMGSTAAQRRARASR